MPRTVYLFDVDGVLVHPLGYKKAMQDTINYFVGQMGVQPLDISHQLIAEFEALGVTNEWESVPFCVAAVLYAAAQQQPALNRRSFNEIISNRLDMDMVNSVSLAELMAQALVASKHHRHSHQFRAFFEQQLPAGWWDELLGDVYNINAPTTAAFQAHTLGEDGYQQTYDAVPPLKRESYLLAYDQPLLDDHFRNQLLEWMVPGQHNMAIFTARPSLPPRDSGASRHHFAPEGDLAAELIGLIDIPLIGAGRLQWLASNHSSLDGAALVKPSPVHALASIVAALTGSEANSLEAAYQFVETGKIHAPLDLLADGQPLHIVVFEDSKGGIEATRSAVALLEHAGIPTTWQAVGIAPETSKQAALAQAGASIVVENINQGLEALWT